MFWTHLDNFDGKKESVLNCYMAMYACAKLNEELGNTGLIEFLNMSMPVPNQKTTLDDEI